MASIFVLGSGAFGLALAIMCRNAGHEVTVWSARNFRVSILLLPPNTKSLTLLVFFEVITPIETMRILQNISTHCFMLEI